MAWNPHGQQQRSKFRHHREPARHHPCWHQGLSCRCPAGANTLPPQASWEQGPDGCAGLPACVFSLPPTNDRSKAQYEPVFLVSKSPNQVPPNCLSQSRCADPGLQEETSETPPPSSTTSAAGQSTYSPGWPLNCDWHSAWVNVRRSQETSGSGYFQRSFVPVRMSSRPSMYGASAFRP